MSALRDYISEDQWWKRMYERYNQPINPDNKNYHDGGRSGIEHPLWIDANKDYAINLTRYDKGTCSYQISRTGGSDNSFNPRLVQSCCNKFGGPYQCVTAALKDPLLGTSFTRYDRMG